MSSLKDSYQIMYSQNVQDVKKCVQSWVAIMYNLHTAYSNVVSGSFSMGNSGSFLLKKTSVYTFGLARLTFRFTAAVGCRMCAHKTLVFTCHLISLFYLLRFIYMGVFFFFLDICLCLFAFVLFLKNCNLVLKNQTWKVEDTSMS